MRPPIKTDDPLYVAAMNALNAMHEFFKLNPMGGAVQWIEDAEGRVVIFTRGEYRDQLMSAVPGYPNDDRLFEKVELEGDEDDR